MKRKRSNNPKLSLYIVIPLILTSLFVFIATIYKIVETVLTNHNSIPKMEISLRDVAPEQLNSGPKDTKYLNNTAALSTDNKDMVFNGVEIAGRGNLTWSQVKKPYQIKLPEKTELFNHKEAKKWVLLANYLDATYLRNDIAFYLERLLNMERSVEGNSLELYIDNIYYGLYYLTEKVEIQENRIDLKESSGIIVELDNLHTPDADCLAHNKNNDCFIVHDITNSDLTTDSISNFSKKFNQLETATTQKNFTTVSSLIDVDSFAKYFLLTEFTNNPDGYESSFYLSMDGPNDLIHAGPGWDFDLAFGNKIWSIKGIDDEVYLSPYNDLSFKSVPLYNSGSTTYAPDDKNQKQSSFVIYNLLEVPEFKARVKEIYQSTLSGHKEELLDHIKSQADYIRDAAYRDQERWKLKTDFNEEIDYLIDWVSKRYDHFEETYGKNSVNAQNNSGTNSVPSPAPESPQL